MVGGQLCDMAYIVPMHVKPKFTYLLTISPECFIYALVNLICIGSGNGLTPVRRQAITWTNAGLLSIEPLETNVSEI